MWFSEVGCEVQTWTDPTIFTNKTSDIFLKMMFNETRMTSGLLNTASNAVTNLSIDASKFQVVAPNAPNSNRRT